MEKTLCVHVIGVYAFWGMQRSEHTSGYWSLLSMLIETGSLFSAAGDLRASGHCLVSALYLVTGLWDYRQELLHLAE